MHVLKSRELHHSHKSKISFFLSLFYSKISVSLPTLIAILYAFKQVKDIRWQVKDWNCCCTWECLLEWKETKSPAGHSDEAQNQILSESLQLQVPCVSSWCFFLRLLGHQAQRCQQQHQQQKTRPPPWRLSLWCKPPAVCLWLISRRDEQDPVALQQDERQIRSEPGGERRWRCLLRPLERACCVLSTMIPSDLEMVIRACHHPIALRCSSAGLSPQTCDWRSKEMASHLKISLAF